MICPSCRKYVFWTPVKRQWPYPSLAPKGVAQLIDKWQLENGWGISHKAGLILSRLLARFGKDSRIRLVRECPHCKFREHPDFWWNLMMRDFEEALNQWVKRSASLA